MKIAIVAVGRLPRSPETELVKLYIERATNAGRSLSLGPVEVVEVESRKPGKAAEAEALRAHSGRQPCHRLRRAWRGAGQPRLR
jgi:23S rRNA (pseudouridine1915-N3)-methyltransferase